MGLNRRNFLGASIGGALAGPTVTRRGLAEAELPVPSVEEAAPSTAYRPQDELRSLLHARRQYLSPNLLTKRHQDILDDQNVQALRSVSPVNKVRITIERELKRQRRAALDWYDRRIAELKAQLGPLAFLAGDGER
jgi:hypothetical protein